MSKCPECSRECEHLENGIHIYNNLPKCCICQKTNNAFIICFECNPKIDWIHFRTTREFKLKESKFNIELKDRDSKSIPEITRNLNTEKLETGEYYISGKYYKEKRLGKTLVDRLKLHFAFIIVTPLFYGLLLGTWEFTVLFACLGAIFSVFYQIIRDWIIESQSK